MSSSLVCSVLKSSAISSLCKITRITSKALLSQSRHASRLAPSLSHPQAHSQSHQRSLLCRSSPHSRPPLLSPALTLTACSYQQSRPAACFSTSAMSAPQENHHETATPPTAVDAAPSPTAARLATKRRQDASDPSLSAESSLEAEEDQQFDTYKTLPPNSLDVDGNPLGQQEQEQELPEAESGNTSGDEGEGSEDASASSASRNKRIRFGSRYLKDESQVFQHNAWDNVEWDPEQRKKAELIVQGQAARMMPTEQSLVYENAAHEFWNSFYTKHESKFFKDRNWLFVEFPELMAKEQTGSFRVFEAGCGVGNTVFPILQTNRNPNLFVYAADFSATAIGILQSNPLYTEESSRCYAFTHDITSPDPYPIEENSLDVIIMIFVLSAVHPSKMQEAISKLARLLKPGGCLLLRDYGRFDLAQLRFKTGKMLSENFYVRGDGTRVYFFTQEDLDDLLARAGLVKEFNRYDNRLIVNRAKQLKMYRVWLQCKYVKPDSSPSDVEQTES